MDRAMAANVLGWGGSALLIFTIAAQIRRQWKAATSEGVSPWLYLGQASASTSLLVYSVLLGAWVFVVLNAAMALAALVGMWIWRRFARTTEARRL